MTDRRTFMGRVAIVVGSVLAVSGARADLIALSTAADDPTRASAVTAKLIGPFGPGSVQLPFTGDITGLTPGTAEANGIVLRPSAGPAVILTAGPPPVGGGVSYAPVTNTSATFLGTATATTGADIFTGFARDDTGAINAVNIMTLTPVTAKVTGIGLAAATATAKTDPFVLAPLSDATPMLLDINLLANYPSDPTGAVQARRARAGEHAL